MKKALRVDANTACWL